MTGFVGKSEHFSNERSFLFTKDKIHWRSFSKAEDKKEYLKFHFSGSGYLSVSYRYNVPFIMLDIDREYDDFLVEGFLRFLREVFDLGAFSSKSFNGRIHIYVPFAFKASPTFAISFAKKLAKISSLYWGMNVEYFPNSLKSYIGLPMHFLHDLDEKIFYSKEIWSYGYENFWRKVNKHANSSDVCFSFLRMKVFGEDIYGKVSYFNPEVKTSFSSSEEMFLALVDRMKEFYMKGNRQNIIFALSGLGAHLGLGMPFVQDALQVLISNDEEYKKRQYLILRAYRRKNENRPLKFLSILREYLGEDFDKFFIYATSKILPYDSNIDVLLNAIDKYIEKNEKKGKKYVVRILKHIREKVLLFGTKFILGYNALSSGLKMSKTDVSNVLKELQKAKVITREKRGYFMIEDGKIVSVGSLYRLNPKQLFRLVGNRISDEFAELLKNLYVYSPSREIYEYLSNKVNNISLQAEFFLYSSLVQKNLLTKGRSYDNISA